MNTQERVAQIQRETAAKIAADHASAEMKLHELEKLAQQLHCAGRNITARTVDDVRMALMKIKAM